MVDVAFFAAKAAGVPCGQPLVLTVGPPVLDGDVLARHIPVVPEALDERVHERGVPGRRGTAQEADPVGAPRRLRGGVERSA
jgi:hypothetical protein